MLTVGVPLVGFTCGVLDFRFYGFTLLSLRAPYYSRPLQRVGVLTFPIVSTNVAPSWNKNRIPYVSMGRRTSAIMMTFILWCILFVLCWPLALLALILYPIVWLLVLPFRIVGIAVGGVLDLIRGIIFLPGRMLQHRRA